MGETNTSERTYLIEGMTCGHCELSVKEQVEELQGIESAHADHATGHLVVLGAEIDNAAVRGAVEAAGYRLATETPAA